MPSPNLCEVVRQWRWASRVELKAAAQAVGVGESTLSRFERGEAVGGETMAKVLRWLLAESGSPRQAVLPIGEEAP